MALPVTTKAWPTIPEVGGWPGSNPKDMEFFKQAAGRKWKSARIAAFSMTRRKGVAVEKDDLMRQVLEADTPVVTIVGKTWLLHVTEVLRVKPFSEYFSKVLAPYYLQRRPGSTPASLIADTNRTVIQRITAKTGI